MDLEFDLDLDSDFVCLDVDFAVDGSDWLLLEFAYNVPSVSIISIESDKSSLITFAADLAVD